MTMSAPDDKISSNRRRLFKALSTAPVVMTLKPGAALATSSAIQCAANEMPLAETKFYLNTTQACSSTSGAGCHAFLERTFWDPRSLATAANFAHWANLFVVETRSPASGSSSTVYWTVVNGLRGNEISPSPSSGANAITQSGSTLYFWDDDGNEFLTVEGRTGLFLAIGEADNPSAPMGWAARTVWPEEPDTSTNVLGGSCLTSFPASGGFKLAES